MDYVRWVEEMSKKNMDTIERALSALTRKDLEGVSNALFDFLDFVECDKREPIPGMTGKESEIIRKLYSRREFMSWDSLMTHMYGAQEVIPERNVCKVYVSNVNRKVREATGDPEFRMHEIVHGFGIKMADRGREVLSELYGEDALK